MIFNLSGDNIQAKIAAFESFDSYNTFVTDAVHIYSYASAPWRTFTNVWLIWKPGDPVEPVEEFQNTQKVRATSTLFIDPYALTNASSIYIPYATSIETFNAEYRWSSDHSDDNLVYTQQCFSTTATIHVNSTLRVYMVNHPEVWGDIINNVVVDL